MPIGIVSFIGSGGVDGGIPPVATQPEPRPGQIHPPVVASLSFVPNPLPENTAFTLGVVGNEMANAFGRYPVAIQARKGAIIVAGVVDGYSPNTIAASFGTTLDDGLWTIVVNFADGATLIAGTIPVGDVLPVISSAVKTPTAPYKTQAFTVAIAGSGFKNDRTPTAVAAINEGTLAVIAGVITGTPTDTAVAGSFASGLPLDATYHFRLTFDDALTASSAAFAISTPDPAVSSAVKTPTDPYKTQAFTVAIVGTNLKKGRTLSTVVAVNEGTLAETSGTITGTPTDTAAAASFASGVLLDATYHFKLTFSDTKTADSAAFAITTPDPGLDDAVLTPAEPDVTQAFTVVFTGTDFKKGRTISSVKAINEDTLAETAGVITGTPTDTEIDVSFASGVTPSAMYHFHLAFSDGKTINSDAYEVVDPPAVSSVTPTPTVPVVSEAFTAVIAGTNFIYDWSPTAVIAVNEDTLAETAGVITGSPTNTEIDVSFAAGLTPTDTYHLRIEFDTHSSVNSGGFLIEVPPVISSFLLSPVAPDTAEAFTGSITGTGFLSTRAPSAIVAVNEGTLAETAGVITGTPTGTNVDIAFASGVPAAATYHFRLEFDDTRTVNSGTLVVVDP